MKALLKSFAAGIIALALAGVSSAQTVIHISGSTAFRAATNQAIVDILNPNYLIAGSGSKLQNSTQLVVSGTTKVGNYPVVIKTNLTGSLAGVQSLAQQSPQIVFSPANGNGGWLLTSLATTTAGSYSIAVTAANTDAAAPADLCLTDSYQASTYFYGSGFTALVDQLVGVVPFFWVMGDSNDPTVHASLTAVNNITSNQIKLLLSSGLPLSLLTGANTDAGVTMYPIGRDEDSGTRLDAFAESGFGVFSSPVQYKPGIGGSITNNVPSSETYPSTPNSNTITGIMPYPANSVDGLSFPVGHSGESSGGNLAKVIYTPVDLNARDQFGGKFAIITYLGAADAQSAVVSGSNAIILNYNGVSGQLSPTSGSDPIPSTATNIINGSYTFWSYEHLDYLPTLSGPAKTVANQLVNQITNVEAHYSGVSLSSMNVSRSVEGGVINHN
jgi:hypothetical protein